MTRLVTRRGFSPDTDLFGGDFSNERVLTRTNSELSVSLLSDVEGRITITLTGEGLLGNRPTLTGITITGDSGLIFGLTGFRITADDADRLLSDPAGITSIFAGADVLVGSSFADELEGFSGNDLIRGGGGGDTLNGGSGDDVVRGGGGADKIAGAAGADRLIGNSGADRVSGGGANDFLSGKGGNDTLIGNAGNDQLEGGNGRDKLKGGSGADALGGGNASDLLNGGGGNDSLIGGGGGDVLRGGRGNDMMNGGGGNDIFVFKTGDGEDRIVAFNISADDKIDLSRIGAIQNFQDLSNNHLRQIGDDILIRAGNDRITLVNKDADSLTDADFIF